MTVSRRNVVKTAAWTAPAIVVATAAPAFATSPGDPKPPKCIATGKKWPGKGKNTKDYTLYAACDSKSKVLTVHIDSVQAKWDYKRGGYTLFGRKDSRSTLPVVITFADNSQWTGVVKFHPVPFQRS